MHKRYSDDWKPYDEDPHINCHLISIKNTKRDEEIRQCRASGMTYQAIADKFHLSPEFCRMLVVRGPSEAQKRGRLKGAKPKSRFGDLSCHGG